MISRENTASPHSMGPDERRAFLQLPLAERRRRLAQQADELISLYDEDAAKKERLERQSGDIVEY